MRRVTIDWTKRVIHCPVYFCTDVVFGWKNQNSHQNFDPSLLVATQEPLTYLCENEANVHVFFLIPKWLTQKNWVVSKPPIFNIVSSNFQGKCIFIVFSSKFILPRLSKINSFASMDPSYPRTNPWNFGEKILRIGMVILEIQWKSVKMSWENNFYFCHILITLIFYVVHISCSWHQFLNSPIHDFFIKIFIYLVFFSELKSSNLFLILKGHQNAFHSIIKIIIPLNFTKKIFVDWWK